MLLRFSLTLCNCVIQLERELSLAGPHTSLQKGLAMRGALALILCVGFAVPAFACLNDRELPSHEREFRSDYGDPASPVPPPPPNLGDFAVNPSESMWLGAGAALVTGAFFVSVNGRRARS